MENKIILIVGANGFIGSHLVEYYSMKDFEVHGLVRVKDNSKSNDIKYHICDLEKDDPTLLLKQIKPHIIIHCAGSANVAKSIDNPIDDFNKNVFILYKILFSIKRIDLKPKFIFLSSAAVYGNNYDLPINEKSELSPISPYGLNKKTCEDICKYFIDIEDLNIIIARIFSVYGTGLRKQILWDSHKKLRQTGKLELFGTGDETRDFIYIDDLIEAINLLVEHNGVYGIYNVASGKEISIKELANEFVLQYGEDTSVISFNGIVKTGDPVRWKADISRLKDIGFQAYTSLAEGLNKYTKWVKQFE